MTPLSAPSIPYSQKAGKQWVCLACNSALGALQKSRGAGKKPGSHGWDNLESGSTGDNLDSGPTVPARSLPIPVPSISEGLSAIHLLLMIWLVVVLPFLLRIIQSRAIPTRTDDQGKIGMTEECIFLLSQDKIKLCCPPKSHCICDKTKKTSWERRRFDFWMSWCCHNPRIHLHYNHSGCFQSWEMFPSQFYLSYAEYWHQQS